MPTPEKAKAFETGTESALRNRQISLNDVKEILAEIQKENPESAVVIAQVYEKLGRLTIPFRPRNHREDAQTIFQLEQEASKLVEKIATLRKIIEHYRDSLKEIKNLPSILDLGLEGLSRLIYQYQGYVKTIKKGETVGEVQIRETEGRIHAALRTLDRTGAQAAFEVAAALNVLGELSDSERENLPEELQEFQIADLLRDVNKRYLFNAQKHHIIFISHLLPDERVYLSGDSYKISRALIAFVDAAIAHIPKEEKMPAGGVDIELNMDYRVSADHRESRQQIRITITDRGVTGMLPTQST